MPVPAPSRRLLAVFAHPDDETGTTGGALALYASLGVETHLVCATRGEVGQAPADLSGYNSVAELREAELRCAASALNIGALHFLDYRDSGMAGSPDNAHPQALAAAPLDQVTRKLALLIRAIRPQVVVTFDPVGGYLHPDHIVTHRATLAAFHMAGDSQMPLDGQAPYAPQKLYYSTFSRRGLRVIVRLLQLFRRSTRFGANRDIDLAEVAAADYPTTTSIDVRPFLGRKEQAARCHASQKIAPTGLARFAVRLFASHETFMLAFPATPLRDRERDLFAGVRVVD